MREKNSKTKKFDIVYFLLMYFGFCAPNLKKIKARFINYIKQC